jgi:hypothetical protein
MRLPFWNILFIVFFIAVAVLGIDWLADRRQLFIVGPWEFTLLALATFRLTRLFTYDHITDFVRGWFRGAPEDSFRATVSGLLNCPWCTGLWFAFLTVFCFFATPYAYPFVLVLAVAGVASLVQLLANFVGWSAEAKKRTISN